MSLNLAPKYILLQRFRILISRVDEDTSPLPILSIKTFLQKMLKLSYYIWSKIRKEIHRLKILQFSPYFRFFLSGMIVKI